ncbi:MAG TPA: SDR family oxidoreductase, partial [Candidatus Methylacidiphilales bacterium]
MANLSDYLSPYMDAYLPERLALTGATGALGFAFLRHNFQRDPKLKASLLIRTSSASFQAEDFQTWLRENEERVTLIDGDVRQLDKAQLQSLLQTDGGLWHFAALTSLTAECEEIAQAIHEVNVEGTTRLIEACFESRDCGPFYHVSTAYVVGKRHGVVQESESRMEQEFRNPYEASKLKAETCVHRAFAAGVPGTIF